MVMMVGQDTNVEKTQVGPVIEKDGAVVLTCCLWKILSK